ncbi:ABC transporter permease [Luteimonas sp. FCS-9]|uniref:ABC transporter permease n=1 Tax=Luteimonas sp. FCS-9 TaxID=1547516 RepID=UPI0021018DB7|nr:ABC transporter permease [Luteimonas sp. FCS-9]
MLGIMIGTAAVISVVSLMHGFSEKIRGQFADMGGGTLTLRAENNNENFRTGKINNITFADVSALRHNVQGIDKVSPMMLVQSAGASYQGRNALPQIIGTSSDRQDVTGQYPEVGRFIVASDDLRNRRVAVIGQQLRDELSMPENPVGHFLMIDREWFKVVGMMPKRGEILGFSQDNFAMIPFEVARSMMGNVQDPVIQATFTASNVEEIDQLRDRVRRVIRHSRRIAVGEEDDFKVEAADSFVKQFDELSGAATVILGGIVAISLLVGGIGIMNIMLVSVTERTREIGVLKALGATRQMILLQFLFEAALLALAGGLAGIFAGYAIGATISSMVPSFPPAHVPLWVVFVSAGFSAVVGVVFGIMPASNAAGLDPVEALRYE